MLTFQLEAKIVLHFESRLFPIAFILEDFCDVTIFTQLFRAVCLERLRENGDVTEIPSSLRELNSS